MDLKQFLEEKAPWLVKDFNGATWESKEEQQWRRIRALENHIQDLEERYSKLENKFNVHAQGTTHRPKRSEPKPDMG